MKCSISVQQGTNIEHRQDKMYSRIGDMELQLKKLNENLESKIKHNLENGIYGQRCYVDDCNEISMLEQKIRDEKEKDKNNKNAFGGDYNVLLKQLKEDIRQEMVQQTDQQTDNKIELMKVQINERIEMFVLCLMGYGMLFICIFGYLLIKN